MSSTRWSLGIACGLAVVALAGCRSPDEISRYQVPHEAKLRMLAAIIPSGERTWFVKVAGPEFDLEEQKAAFGQFLGSLELNDKADPPMKWKELPKGWRQEEAQPKKGEFKRFATFRLPVKEGPDLELTVFPLGKEGAAASVLANVNRWRGQLGLEALAPAELPEAVKEVKLTGAVATVVDMVGTVTQLAAAAPPPFAGHGAVEAPPADERALPTYNVPPGWEKAPLKQFSIATFRTGKGERAADVTASLVGGGLALNLSRWRKQVGLPEVGQEDIMKGVRQIEVDGARAPYVEMIGPEKDGRRTAILGAVPTHGGRMWFFKMMGPADVVAEQKAPFEAFVRSVRFPRGKEGQP